MKKTGQLIAFFGPDGTGKTTTATLVEEMLRNQGVSTFHYHWRPRFLPSLNNEALQNHDFTNPNKLPTRSWSISLIAYIYFFLDFTLAYLIRFRPMMRNGAIIIYERYYYDLLFHPKRYKLRSISFMANLLTWLAPKPDLIVLLSGESTMIRNRKAELSLQEIIRQQNEMKVQLVNFGEVLSIDVTSAGSKECARQVFRSILLI